MKSRRHVKILELIDKNDIETQEELALELQQAGYEVTQATISRDIKELGIVKVSYDGKRQKYIREAIDRTVSGKIANIFRHAVLSIDSAVNIVVIRTVAGSGNAAGMMIDRMDESEILGCVAGDDTVIVVTRSEQAALSIVETLNEMINR